jgi:plasmid stabilization system protein ParE
MKVTVSVSGRAESDLTHQYRWYLDNANSDVAERFLKAFGDTTIKLAQQPGIGWARKFRAPELAGIRSFPIVGRFCVHLIFYRVSGKALSIERVMHGARDLPQRLLEPPEE